MGVHTVLASKSIYGQTGVDLLVTNGEFLVLVCVSFGSVMHLKAFMSRPT
jgi:hypothetical protein